MSTKQDQLLHFSVRFNAVLMNHEMPPLEKISQILQLQKDFYLLPNEQSKVIFALHANLELGDCYVKAHQKYMLTPLVEQCKQLLAQLEEYDFLTQPAEVWDYLAERLESYFGQLIDLCQAKNHQRDVAYCYNEVARIWDKVGNKCNFVKAIVCANIAQSKVPGVFALSKQQLLLQFADHAQVVEDVFGAHRALKTDPIEQSQQYLAIYDDAERIIQGLIEEQGRIARSPEQYWSIKAEVLKFHFGMDWQSPRLLNPNVKF